MKGCNGDITLKRAFVISVRMKYPGQLELLSTAPHPPRLIAIINIGSPATSVSIKCASWKLYKIWAFGMLDY
jgi:hypothetical protein